MESKLSRMEATLELISKRQAEVEAVAGKAGTKADESQANYEKLVPYFELSEFLNQQLFCVYIMIFLVLGLNSVLARHMGHVFHLYIVNSVVLSLV